MTSPGGQLGDLGNALRRVGFVVVRAVASATVVDQLRVECDALLRAERRPGIRNIVSRLPSLRSLIDGERWSDLLAALGAPRARVVRSILFDKSAATNWMVPWHQDATIAVRARADVEGFGPWSIKDGEHHCRPAPEVMERLLALRLHLDDNDETNGPLRVIPGSHARGLLHAAEIAELAAGLTAVTCTARAGDVVVMRPHLVHASAKSTSAARRRVVHIEYCDAALPSPLEWAEALL